jgi:hypothetical protein
MRTPGASHKRAKAAMDYKSGANKEYEVVR